MNIKAGNFYFYGEWHPEYNESLNLFLDETNKNEEAFVCIGDADSGMVGVISTFPEGILRLQFFALIKILAL